MDTSRIGSEVVELLSRITGQKLSQRDITPPVLFLANLITLLLGVIFADRQVTDEEKQKLQKTLNHFIPSEGNVRQLTQLMLKGVREHKIYAKSENYRILTAPLSHSEKLLLICFGYEMSAADGNIDESEKNSLQLIGELLNLNSQHLKILELAFSDREIEDLLTLKIVCYLLDPSRFQSLDLIFVNAASYILEQLQTTQEQQQEESSQRSSHRDGNSSYKKLQEFQEYQKKIDRVCYQIYQILQDCINRDFLSSHLLQELGKISQKIQSHNFKVAVLGEFSQGKSTFLNALLGEEIQPVRAIPCSGVVTVLKYGSQKQVICRYKDKREVEIPFEEYKLKASISKEAALEHRSEELSKAEIEEIIFEHPDLDLCRSGVEILDSPGLNEHPERTAITQKLLKNTDAALFLTNAMRLLSEREKELLQDVKAQLNGGQDNKTAENLFILVNFMDCLDDEDDRQDVKQRLEKFVEEKNLLSGKERIHYISAKSTLKAILSGTEDEHLKAFQVLTQSLEEFLTNERGTLKTKRSVFSLQELIKNILEALYKAEYVLSNRLKTSEEKTRSILEYLGIITGKNVKVVDFVKQRIKSIKIQLGQELETSWDMWLKDKYELKHRLSLRSKNWKSDFDDDPVWKQKEIVEDYSKQLEEDILTEIINWSSRNKVRLDNYLESLDWMICKEIDELLQDNTSLEKLFLEKFNYEFSFNVSKKSLYGNLFEWVGGIIENLISFEIFDAQQSIRDRIKSKVIEEGYKRFEKNANEVYKDIYSIVPIALESRIKPVKNFFKQEIKNYEQQLQEADRAYQTVLKEYETEKAWIDQKHQELDRVREELETVLSQLSR